jgi:plastocyanin
MSSPRIYLLISLLVFAGSGCDKHRETAPSTPTPASIAPTGSGKIVGRVLLNGTPPSLPPIDVSAVSDCAKLHPQGLPDESVVVGADGALRNVIVYLKDMPATGDGASRPPMVLDQIGCQYRPHVAAVQTGQIVRVESQDPFIHNVNVRSFENPSNFSQLASGATVPQHDLVFDKPEIFSVKCDVHPWMRAWIGVFDHPYFAVTDASGAFEIDHVPAGTFTIVAWQERLGEVPQQVVVEDGKTKDVDFTFSR